MIYFRQRQKSPLVKHYHQQEIKRLETKITQIKNRKKGILPEDKQNTLPLLPPKYQLTLNRQQQIKVQNDRLSARIATTKVKSSQYFKKMLKEKQKITNLHLKSKNLFQSMQVKLLYSSSIVNILNGNLSNSVVSTTRKGPEKRTLIRAQTQRAQTQRAQTQRAQMQRVKLNSKMSEMI